MESVTPEFLKYLRALGERPECPTRRGDYPFWLLQHTQGVLLRLLRDSGIRLTDDLCADLARWTFAAALVSKCLVERMTAAQARLVVLAPAVNGLLFKADALPRLKPSPLEPSSDDLDALLEYCRTGIWPTDGPLRGAIQERAVAQLSACDALLIGLLLAVGSPGDALLVLDLEEEDARQVLAGAYRRLQGAMRRLAEDHLRQAGRRPPPRFSVN